MAYYRHFVERKDFEVFVATDNPQIHDYAVPYPYLFFQSSRALERLKRTRFSTIAHSISHLFEGKFILKKVEHAAVQFKPDLIMTVGGSWSWTALMAWRLADKLKLPFVSSFNDWFDYNLITHPHATSRIEEVYRQLYLHCDLALCTSEGMREALGSHPNAKILYPMGAPFPASPENYVPYRANGKPYAVAFAGNMGEWYGRMLERLASKSRREKAAIDFRFFGSNASWSREFDAEMKRDGKFRGQIPFKELQSELSKVDALLLLMGFDNDCAQIERTSFKTKFLDYLSFQKPILLWGPEYCSAVRIAREFDSAEICTSPDETEFLTVIQSLAQNPRRQQQLVDNARRMYEDRFHPNKIHGLLVEQCLKLREKIGLKTSP